MELTVYICTGANLIMLLCIWILNKQAIELHHLIKSEFDRASQLLVKKGSQ